MSFPEPSSFRKTSAETIEGVATRPSWPPRAIFDHGLALLATGELPPPLENPNLPEIRPRCRRVPDLEKLPDRLRLPPPHLLDGRPPEKGLHACEGARGPRRQVRRDPPRSIENCRLRLDLLHQSKAQRLFGREHRARGEDLRRGSASDPEAQHLGASGEDRGAEGDLVER